MQGPDALTKKTKGIPACLVSADLSIHFFKQEGIQTPLFCFPATIKQW